MPQKKKTANKKTNKKSYKKHLTQKQNIIFQSIPNYASGQMGGHQYNKDHVPFAQPATPQSHTDNIVGELVSKLIGKIENDGNKEVQQYSKEVQPINNNNYVNIYKDGIEESKTDKKPDEITDEITTKGRSAAEDYGIQTASAVTGLLGIGALGYAANTESAGKAKMKLKGVGSGILGAVTSGASAIGSAINNNILKRGNKLGKGEKLAEGEKVYEKSGKPGTYAQLKDELIPESSTNQYFKKGEPNPLQQDFDSYLGKKNIKLDKYMKSKYGHLLQSEPPTTPIKNDNIVPKPASTPTPTPTPSKNSVFAPAIYLSNLKPHKILLPSTPSLDLLKAGTPKPKYMMPVEEQVKQLNAGGKITGAIKRKVAQLDYEGFRKEAKKIQKTARNYIKRKREVRFSSINLVPSEPEITLAPTPPPAAARARRSGVQQSDKVLTRSKAAESGIGPVQLQLEKQPRKIYPSDVGEYRSGQRARNKDIAKNIEKQFAPVWNMEDKYNQGYFSKELAKRGPRPKSSVLSQAETPAPEKRNFSKYMKER